MKKIKAFTLSEVLICLAIVGVIAAMTVPALKGSVDRSANAEACKKAGVYLADVMEATRTMGDSYEKWTYNDDNTDVIMDRIKPLLNIVKECKDAAGCWTPSVTGLNKAATVFTSQGYGTPARSYKLADGSNLTIDITGAGYNVTRNRTTTLLFAVDVNGDRKPNRLGEDVFVFMLGDNGVLPAGKDATGNGDCTRAGEGFDCAGRIIREGGINY